MVVFGIGEDYYGVGWFPLRYRGYTGIGCGQNLSHKRKREAFIRFTQLPYLSDD